MAWACIGSGHNSALVASGSPVLSSTPPGCDSGVLHLLFAELLIILFAKFLVFILLAIFNLFLLKYSGLGNRQPSLLWLYPQGERRGWEGGSDGTNRGSSLGPVHPPPLHSALLHVSRLCGGWLLVMATGVTAAYSR